MIQLGYPGYHSKNDKKYFAQDTTYSILIIHDLNSKIVLCIHCISFIGHGQGRNFTFQKMFTVQHASYIFCAADETKKNARF